MKRIPSVVVMPAICVGINLGVAEISQAAKTLPTAYPSTHGRDEGACRTACESKCRSDCHEDPDATDAYLRKCEGKCFDSCKDDCTSDSDEDMLRWYDVSNAGNFSITWGNS